MRNRKMTWLLIASMTLAISHGAMAADCSDAGNNAISDASVANLQQMEAVAEARAASAKTSAERQRWEDTARSFAAQAQAMQTRNSAIASLASKACDALLNSDDGDD